jgi:eukaryotic-like serine/threonine-protein kinase
VGDEYQIAAERLGPMNLDPGARLGPYEIVSKLGDGGMGVVYRGVDTRLGREVAIKVLAATTASLPEALARFEREGRAIASLNHPNICTLFDVGTANGHPYLVMELLEGSTLHQALTQGPLPIDAVVNYGIELADALRAAHTRGIIHRDLKPANVFLTTQDTIKILDFGLAKADGGRQDETRMDAGLTGPGATLGTVAYMSPEQLRGGALDVRTDLFSLGLVLYEMATGQRAFGGQTGAEVSGAILHAEPARPHSLRRELPEKLEEIILKALEKDRDLRYQSAADLRGDLRRLKRRDYTEPALASSARVVASAPPPSSSDAAVAMSLARRHPIALASLVLIALGAAGTGWWGTRREGAAPSAPTSELSIQALTLDGQAGHATISPDGRFIAYVRRTGVQSSLVVKQLSSDSDVVILPPLTGVIYDAPSVTPDGGFIDVLVRRATAAAPIGDPAILRVPFLGGPPRRLLDGAISGIGWSPDGQRMAYLKFHPGTQLTSLIIADPQGQNARVLATRDAPSRFGSVLNNLGKGPPSRPSWSTDGRFIALAGLNLSPERFRDPSELIEIDAGSGAERVLRRIEGWISEVAYLDTDSLVVSVANLEKEPFQWRLYPRNGSAAALTRGLNDIQGIQLTANRTAGVATQTIARSSIVVGPAAGGTFSEVVAESGAQPWSAVFDSRGNLVYTARAPSGWAAFRSDGARGGGAMMAADVLETIPSPDATFVIGRRPAGGLVRVNADGSGTMVILQGASAFPRAFTPDGAGLVYISNQSGPQQPWLLPLPGGEPRRLSEIFVGNGQLWLSRDGRRVILLTSARTRLCVFPTFDSCQVLNVTAGPLSADGKTVFAVDPNDPRNIIAQPIDGGTPTPLTHFTDKVIDELSLSPDGSRIAITRTSRVSDVVLIKGLK